jgi:hypothetical protein
MAEGQVKELGHLRAFFTFCVVSEWMLESPAKQCKSTKTWLMSQRKNPLVVAVQRSDWHFVDVGGSFARLSAIKNSQPPMTRAKTLQLSQGAK